MLSKTILLTLWVTLSYHQVRSAPTHPLIERSATTLSSAITGYLATDKQSSTIPLSNSQITNQLHLVQAVQFAQAAYCESVSQLKWSCGSACSATSDTKVLWTFGDNRRIPYVYVAHSPSLDAIVVAHAGSNFDSRYSYLTDFNIVPDMADSDLDDGSSGEEPANVHSGFHDVWQKTSTMVLKQVKEALKTTGVKTVLCTGHSLGAAVSQLDAVYLRNELPKAIVVENIAIATPRVGDKRWANVVDRVMGNFQVHVINDRDIVPRTPPTQLGFWQAKNEIWIDRDDNKVLLCRGEENEDCSNSISRFETTADDHEGPYFGVRIDSGTCR